MARPLAHATRASYTRDMQTRTYARVRDRLRRLTGRELAAVAAAAGVGRSTIYRLRADALDAPDATANARDSTIARLDHALRQMRDE